MMITLPAVTAALRTKAILIILLQGITAIPMIMVMGIAIIMAILIARAILTAIAITMIPMAIGARSIKETAEEKSSVFFKEKKDFSGKSFFHRLRRGEQRASQTPE